ncbi:uncharacterized protein LOC126176081 [Schistocerca cancellata]|uniref:uncharacterized protein LOC126176081 n=1 Tax=Schistocerca cancellata TaxID=274614 RepID=UPI00211895FD|nr:uncharacterized protein LOC126176081 [Schistocerca cancellata]
MHCRHCQYKTKHKHDLLRHQRNRHADFHTSVWNVAKRHTCIVVSAITKLNTNMIWLGIREPGMVSFTITSWIFSLHQIPPVDINIAANILGSTAVLFRCDACGRVYRHRDTLTRHQRVECGKEAHLHCSHCHYKTKYKHNLVRHQGNRHADIHPCHL